MVLATGSVAASVVAASAWAAGPKCDGDVGGRHGSGVVDRVEGSENDRETQVGIDREDGSHWRRVGERPGYVHGLPVHSPRGGRIQLNVAERRTIHGWRADEAR